MPLLNINDVMAEHFQGAPTFLSVDTEGFDLAILKSIDYTPLPTQSHLRDALSAPDQDETRNPRVHGDPRLCRPRRVVCEHHFHRFENPLITKRN